MERKPQLCLWCLIGWKGVGVPPPPPIFTFMILPTWWNGRQKMAIATLCVLCGSDGHPNQIFSGRSLKLSPPLILDVHPKSKGGFSLITIISLFNIFIQMGLFFFTFTLFNNVSSAAQSDPLCRRMLGINNPGLLQHLILSYCTVGSTNFPCCFKWFGFPLKS